MAQDGGDWRRLGEHVVRRREELGLTQPEVHAAGGPSTAAMRQIEQGSKDGGYRGSTLRSLERALRWRTGSVEAVLDGGDPTPSDVVTTGDTDFDALITWLTGVADNPNRDAPLRAWARAQITQLAAIRAADQAAAQERGEAV